MDMLKRMFVLGMLLLSPQITFSSQLFATDTPPAPTEEEDATLPPPEEMSDPQVLPVPSDEQESSPPSDDPQLPSEALPVPTDTSQIPVGIDETTSPQDDPQDIDMDQAEDNAADMDTPPSSHDHAPSQDAASEPLQDTDQSSPGEEEQAFEASFDASKGDAMTITPGSGGGLVKPGIDMVKRNKLVDEAKQIQKNAREAINRLDDYKKSRSTAYLDLDEQLDAFYLETGLARGGLKEDVDDVSEALLNDVMAGGSHGAQNDVQAKVSEQQKKLRALGDLIENVKGQEYGLLKSLKDLADKTDDAFNRIIRIGNLVDALRGLPTDQEADESMKKIKEEQAAIKSVEAATEGELGKAIDAARASIEKGMKEVRDQIASLKAAGVDFVGKAREVLSDRPASTPRPVKGSAPAVEKEVATSKAPDKAADTSDKATDTPDADQESRTQKDKASKKKKKKKKEKPGMIAGMLEGTPLEGAGKAVSSFFGAIKDGVVASAHMVKDGVVSVVDRVMGVEEEKKDKKKGGKPGKKQAEMTSPTKPAEKPLSDPVLERIRIERKQSSERMQSLFDQRKAIEMKESLLDRLEVERIMQMDRKAEVQHELDRAYKRKDKELSWIQIGKRVMWKLYASLQRVWIALRGWYGGKVKKRAPKHEGKADPHRKVHAPAPTASASEASSESSSKAAPSEPVVTVSDELKQEGDAITTGSAEVNEEVKNVQEKTDKLMEDIASGKVDPSTLPPVEAGPPTETENNTESEEMQKEMEAGGEETADLLADLGVGDEPEMPEEPELLGDEPAEPEIPEEPDVPEVPEEPATPDVPEEPALPEEDTPPLPSQDGDDATIPEDDVPALPA